MSAELARRVVAPPAAELLLALTPSRAHRIDGDRETDVPIEAIVSP